MLTSKFTAGTIWAAVSALAGSWFVIRPEIDFILINHFVVLFIFAGIAMVSLAYYLYIAVYAFFYRPAPALPDDRLPGCTVIVPAYNEGKHVADTLESLLAADFPRDKLEIIAIDDGSRDDTLQWIRSVAERSNGMVTPVWLSRNQGKKHALYRGILMARHDVIVTVDSDSIVEKKALRNIVSAFAAPDVGGVAGNIRIKNLSEGIIPRMMDVGFMFGFEVIRSAQSVIGCVMCTPGALSAYRKSLVMPFLDEWLNQSFLGAPATIGEDRAITSMIIRHGHRVLFQQNAVAHTCIPHTFSRFAKMLVRWTRSDVRENLLMVIYAFSRLPRDHRQQGLQIHVATQWLGLTVASIYPVFLAMVLICAPGDFLRYIYASLTFGSVGALIPAFIYARRVSPLDSVWAVMFTGYTILALFWIPLYSLLTVRNSSWLTRELPRKRGGIAKLPTESAH